MQRADMSITRKLDETEIRDAIDYAMFEVQDFNPVIYSRFAAGQLKLRDAMSEVDEQRRQDRVGLKSFADNWESECYTIGCVKRMRYGRAGRLSGQTTRRAGAQVGLQPCVPGSNRKMRNEQKSAKTAE